MQTSSDIYIDALVCDVLYVQVCGQSVRIFFFIKEMLLFSKYTFKLIKK